MSQQSVSNPEPSTAGLDIARRFSSKLDEVIEGLGNVVSRLESNEHGVAALKEEVRFSVDGVLSSLNLLRNTILETLQQVRELTEDRRHLDARLTVAESNWKRLESRVTSAAHELAGAG